MSIAKALEAIDKLLVYVEKHCLTPDYGDRLEWEFIPLDTAVYREVRRLGLQDADMPRRYQTKEDDETMFYGRTNVPCAWKKPRDGPCTLVMKGEAKWVWDMLALRALVEACATQVNKADDQPPANEGGMPPAGPTSHPAVVNSIELSGDVWQVRYEDGRESRTFKDQKNSVFHHLVRLLAAPNRHFKVTEFFRPADANYDPILHQGRDESSDKIARAECEKEMERIANEIKEAKNANDVGRAERLQSEFYAIAEHLDSENAARKRGRKNRCGTKSPLERADQNLRMMLRNLYERLRTKGLPKLADHLEKYIDNSECEWRYAPPQGTSPWHTK